MAQAPRWWLWSSMPVPASHADLAAPRILGAEGYAKSVCWLLQVPPEMHRELFKQAQTYMAKQQGSGTWTQFVQDKGFNFEKTFNWQDAAGSLFGTKKG
jgi:hypothetical protein